MKRVRLKISLLSLVYACIFWQPSAHAQHVFSMPFERVRYSMLIPEDEEVKSGFGTNFDAGGPYWFDDGDYAEDDGFVQYLDNVGFSNEYGLFSVAFGYIADVAEGLVAHNSTSWAGSVGYHSVIEGIVYADEDYSDPTAAMSWGFTADINTKWKLLGRTEYPGVTEAVAREDIRIISLDTGNPRTSVGEITVICGETRVVLLNSYSGTGHLVSVYKPGEDEPEEISFSSGNINLIVLADRNISVDDKVDLRIKFSAGGVFAGLTSYTSQPDAWYTLGASIVAFGEDD